MIEEDEDALPAVEVDGLKFIDATGEDLPPEVIEAFIEALHRVGAVRRDESTGLLVPNVKNEGEVMGIQFVTNDAGEIINASMIEDEDLPPELKKQ